MCEACTPTPAAPVVIEPRPRQRAAPGIHAESSLKTRMKVRCDLEDHRVWYTSSSVLCGRCGHDVGTELGEDLRKRLRNRLRAQIGRVNNYVADDWDDSAEGLKQMATILRATFPFLRLQSKQQHRSLFRIATIQHAQDTLDNNAGSLTELTERSRILASKIENEITALLEAGLK